VAGGEASADYIISESGSNKKMPWKWQREKRVVAYRLLPIQSKIKWKMSKIKL